MSTKRQRTQINTTNPSQTTALPEAPFRAATKTAASPKTGRKGNAANLIPAVYGQRSRVKSENLPPTFAFGTRSPSELGKKARSATPNARGRTGAYSNRGVVVTTFPDQEAAILAFTQANETCRDNADQIRRFLGLVKNGELNGIDVVALVRGDRLSHREDIGRKQGVYSGIGRFANGAFSPKTRGANAATTRGKKELPSLLWAIIQRGCGELEGINDFIENILSENAVPQVEYVDGPFTITPQEQTKRNKEIADFISAHPRCTASATNIRIFLNLIDSYHLNAEDIFAILRVAGLNGGLGTFENKAGDISKILPGKGRSRSANLSFAAYTEGVRGEAKDQLKYTFLWDMIGRYCEKLGDIIKYAIAMLTGAIEYRMKE